MTIFEIINDFATNMLKYHNIIIKEITFDKHGIDRLNYEIIILKYNEPKYTEPIIVNTSSGPIKCLGPSDLDKKGQSV